MGQSSWFIWVRVNPNFCLGVFSFIIHSLRCQFYLYSFFHFQGETQTTTHCWATVIWKKWVIPLINSLLNQTIWFFWQHFISHLTEDNIKWKWIVFIQFCTKHNRICLIQSYEKYCAQIEGETWLNASKIAFRSKLQSTCKHIPPETL